jgi:putative hydrolase of the HAD superfamily
MKQVKDRVTEITTLLWDVGGVVLTDGWDQAIRRKTAERFHLDVEDFQERHEQVEANFETGRLSLEQYLYHTVFYRLRPFTINQFKDYMIAQSQPHAEVLAILSRMKQSGRYLLVALNNESLELNLARIERFGLRRYFTLFFSSCFVGVRKPDEGIYRLALRVMQRDPQACLFIDDRTVNLEPAQSIGISTIHYRSPAQLLDELQRSSVHIPLHVLPQPPVNAS